MTDPNVPASKTALETQKGGDHYKTMGIQPVEFCMVNGWDCCAFSTLKYLSRHRRKEGKLDVEKALHFVELREQLPTPDTIVHLSKDCKPIPIQTYIEKNEGFDELDEKALEALAMWVRKDHKSALVTLKQTLIAIIDNYR